MVNKELCPPDAAGVELGIEVVDDVVLFLVVEMGELPELERVDPVVNILITLNMRNKL